MIPVDYAVAVGAGALTGFVCAVPVGPINVAIMEEGIHSGRTRALIIAVGALLMEMQGRRAQLSKRASALLWAWTLHWGARSRHTWAKTFSSKPRARQVLCV